MAILQKSIWVAGRLRMRTDDYKAYVRRTRALLSLVWVLAINAVLTIIQLVF
jgi:hypothetical protein